MSQLEEALQGGLVFLSDSRARSVRAERKHGSIAAKTLQTARPPLQKEVMCPTVSDCSFCRTGAEKSRPSAAADDGEAGAAATTTAALIPDQEEDDEEAGKQPALRLFERLTPAAIEALRYRGEDIARGLTKAVVQEVLPFQLFPFNL